MDGLLMLATALHLLLLYSKKDLFKATMPFLSASQRVPSIFDYFFFRLLFLVFKMGPAN